ncbi:MAG: NAD(P)H-hydrate epimerase [Nitrososphaerales archaeon]|nr:NAD(P)H-hydrate epimerase [Nitrososphaerales archaeon]
MKLVNGITYVSAEEMKQIDGAAIGDYGIDVLSLMENAGLATATVAKTMLDGDARGKKVACMAGKGNNGGDGLVAARHLRNWGAEVSVVLAASPEELEGAPAKQFSTIQRMGIKTLATDADLDGFDLLLDALLGYNSKGNPREPVAGLIRKANASGVPVLAVDLPSGLDPTTGEPGDPCVAAKATVTLALPKSGFLNPRAKRFAGQLYLADISIPRVLYDRYLVASPFGKDTIIMIP